SDLSTIEISIPADKQSLFTGYHIALSRHGASANDANCTDAINKVGLSNSTKIAQDVRSNCEYLVVLEFGEHFAGPPEQLKSVTYSNKAKGGNGDVVPADKMKPGAVDLAITVF